MKQHGRPGFGVFASGYFRKKSASGLYYGLLAYAGLKRRLRWKRRYSEIYMKIAVRGDIYEGSSEVVSKVHDGVRGKRF